MTGQLETMNLSLLLYLALDSEKRRRDLVVMDFDCYTGDRGSIATHGDSLSK